MGSVSDLDHKLKLGYDQGSKLTGSGPGTETRSEQEVEIERATRAESGAKTMTKVQDW